MTALSPALLLSLVYLFVIGGTGAWGPFLGLHLERAGHSGAWIGALLALIPLTRILSAPLWAALADRFRRGATLLRLATGLSTLAAVVVTLDRFGTPGLAVALVAFAFLRAPIGPLLDSAAVQQLVAGGGDARDYGRLRLWGSVGFMALAGLASVLVADADSGRPALWLAVGTWVLATLLTFVMPGPPTAAPAPVLPALRALARAPFLAPLMVGLTLHGAGLAVYDMLLPMHMDGLGLGGGWTGAALGMGIAAEIAIMAVGGRLLQRAPPGPLLVLAALVGAVRWALLAVVTTPWLVVALQASHGIVFGVFWVAGVELMRTQAPAEVRNSAQSLLMISAYGVGSLLTAGATSLWLDAIGTAGLFLAGGAAGLLSTGALALSTRALRASSSPPA
ncbi:MAG: MFS transporter [Alphaproteobacteria bacterium]|nr:MFS transporter [Alphaproteobacteria bacterium]